MPKFIRRLSSGSIFVLHSHTGLAAIEYTYIIGERRSKYLEPEFRIAIRNLLRTITYYVYNGNYIPDYMYVKRV